MINQKKTFRSLSFFVIFSVVYNIHEKKLFIQRITLADAYEIFQSKFFRQLYPTLTPINVGNSYSSFLAFFL